MLLRDLGEFGWLHRLPIRVQGHERLLHGIGDDCAVVRSGTQVLLLTSDASVENVHFRRSTATPFDIGWKAAASAISDIAAMGGQALALTLSIGAPDSIPVAELDAIFDGVQAAADTSDTVVAGGDLVHSPAGLFLDVAVSGIPGPAGRVLLRGGAKAGDAVLVTGWPGTSAAGFRALERGQQALRACATHLRPQPRLREGQWLAAQDDVRACIDVSDGVLQDAEHVARQSGLRIALDAGRLPISEALNEAAGALELDAMQLALRGGEDYELLITAGADSASALIQEFETAFGLALSQIGVCSEGDAGVDVKNAGTTEAAGFDHFRTP